VPDEFLTVADVAELLKLNQQTIRNWLDRGELPAFGSGAGESASVGPSSTRSSHPADSRDHAS
jgi:excisionase family DNA binding protein